MGLGFKDSMPGFLLYIRNVGVSYPPVRKFTEDAC